MEALIYLDTHVVAWLYSGHTHLLSTRARASIEQGPLLVSPMVILELEFLKEVGRLTVGGNVIVENLRARIGIELCDFPFQKIVASARDVTWTRDPFDRVIVGHAAAAGRGLLTKDRSIRRKFHQAVW